MARNAPARISCAAVLSLRRVHYGTPPAARPKAAPTRPPFPGLRRDSPAGRTPLRPASLSRRRLVLPPHRPPSAVERPYLVPELEPRLPPLPPPPPPPPSPCPMRPSPRLSSTRQPFWHVWPPPSPSPPSRALLPSAPSPQSAAPRARTAVSDCR
eukprot:5543789-Prymnesium_polylepis.10